MPIGLQSGHARLGICLRRRGTLRHLCKAWVMFRGSVERDAECIYLGAAVSRRHKRPDVLPEVYCLDCMILLHLGPCSPAACVEALSVVDRTCCAQFACAVVNLSGRPQACLPRTCRAHAASAPSGTEHPPRTSAPLPCAEGGRARALVLAAPFVDAASWAQHSAARADLACRRSPTRAPKVL